jgi:hypothetical protein
VRQNANGGERGCKMHARVGEKERDAHARGGGDAGKGGVTRRMEASTGTGRGAEDGGEHEAMVTV